MSDALNQIDKVEGEIKKNLFGSDEGASKEVLLKIVADSFKNLPEIVKTDLKEKEKINDTEFQTDVLKALIEKYKVENDDVPDRINQLDRFLKTLGATAGGRRRTRRRKRSSRRRRKSH